MAVEKDDDLSTPRDLIIQMGLRDHIGPLVTLIDANRDSSAIVEMVVELAMAIAVRSYCETAERRARGMTYGELQWDGSAYPSFSKAKL